MSTGLEVWDGHQTCEGSHYGLRVSHPASGKTAVLNSTSAWFGVDIASLPVANIRSPAAHKVAVNWNCGDPYLTLKAYFRVSRQPYWHECDIETDMVALIRPARADLSLPVSKVLSWPSLGTLLPGCSDPYRTPRATLCQTVKLVLKNESLCLKK